MGRRKDLLPFAMRALWGRYRYRQPHCHLKQPTCLSDTNQEKEKERERERERERDPRDYKSPKLCSSSFLPSLESLGKNTGLTARPHGFT